jgi:hypothetical protein
MKTVGGAAEVKLFGDCDEVTEMAQFDISIHTLEIIMRTNKILDISVRES